MSRTTAIRDAWRPQTAHDRAEVLRELEQVLASQQFCNSKRYPALLQYIVDNTLAGKADVLKERTIGVEVFDRPSSYDTNADTVVRYTAGEVRKRLSLYYAELDRKPSIQISLPAGSYIPEFIHAGEVEEQPVLLREREVREAPAHIAEPVVEIQSSAPTIRRWMLFTVAGVVLLILLGFVGWHSRSVHPRSPMDEFWSPLLRDQHTILVCSGGVVFKEGNFSGVITAGKNIDYPFVSSQIASSIARIAELLARDGAKMDLQFSASTPLTVLREQPLILLGGYNNQWTMRLLDPLPYHFTPEDGAIINTQQPGEHWSRDKTQPYSSTDDYALIARFRDATTGSWVIVLAGLGRNGTEAAAQFVTSPHYMQVLHDRLGSDFDNRNVEAVLRVNVIEGRTGAPSVLAVHAW